MEINIRIAEKKDLDEIVRFNQEMALETEKLILIDEIIRQGVKNVLDNSKLGFYIVAEIDAELISSLMVTTEWSDWRNGIFWWVQSVYVVPNHRKKGVYRMMYDFVKALAKIEASVIGFRLYVEKNNLPAMATYNSLGMSETHYRLYEELL